MTLAQQHSPCGRPSAAESDVVAERLARMEAEVAAGVRDARSLVLIPREIAVSAELSFPKDPYGVPEDW